MRDYLQIMGQCRFFFNSAFILIAKINEYSGARDVNSGPEKIKSTPTHDVHGSVHRNTITKITKKKDYMD